MSVGKYSPWEPTATLPSAGAAVGSVARRASAPTEGGEGRGHMVAAARLQLVYCALDRPHRADALSDDARLTLHLYLSAGSMAYCGGRGGFNGRPLVQWPTRPMGGWALEAPGLGPRKAKFWLAIARLILNQTLIQLGGLGSTVSSLSGGPGQSPLPSPA